jgi:putative restriction endonuclease
MSPLDLDLRVRVGAFEWLRGQVELYGDVLPWRSLIRGFEFDGRRVPLVGPEGIFKPAILPQLPLSILTTADSPYEDAFGADGLLNYAYRGQDPEHHSNRRLRAAIQRRVPLVYFHGVAEGKYLAAWPVFIVGDLPGKLKFVVALDDAQHASAELLELATEGRTVSESTDDARRSYITTTLRQRLHQRGFRERVLSAYRTHCAFCRLRHEELLDAAHIIPDNEERGEPIVPNGLSLCKLHHAAYDRQFLGVRPDYVIEVRRDLLEEEDGPMLLHGLKGMHLKPLFVPRAVDSKPDPERLKVRWERFRAAG